MSTHNEHIAVHTGDTKKETRANVITLVTLLILTLITVGASYIDFGQGNIVIALAIATVKAMIVALFFMHLLHDKPINSVVAMAGFLFLGLFLTFTLLDLDYRKDAIPQNCAPGAICSGARGIPGAPGVAAPAPGGAAPAPGVAAPAPGGAAPAAAPAASPTPAADKRE
jgi:cytochrome c oxidase subunit IV